MGKKKGVYVRITEKDNYLRNQNLSLPKCSVCHEEKPCNRYPCELDYRTQGKVKCDDTVTICSKCFDSNNIYTCANHKENEIKDLNCEFTGLYSIDSPVYFIYGDLGIRKLGDYECKRCNKDYKVCHMHIEVEYKYCRNCLIKLSEDGFKL